MRFKLPPWLIVAALFVAAVVPTCSQTVPAASQGGLPIVIGAGISDYSIDWGGGRRMEGITAWTDWYPTGLKGMLHGLGVEAEGRDTNFGLPSGLSRMRQDTGLGGAIYQWNRYSNFHPYGKYLLGIGSIDFPPFPGFPNFTHDNYLVLSPGGGLEYRAWQHLWVRADYEYQFWRVSFGPHDLSPNGFTVGVSYDFRPTDSAIQ